MAVKTNAHGEVLDVATVSQFLPGHTEFGCGFWTAAMILYAGEPGTGPTGTVAQIDAWALNQYTKVYGSNGPDQEGGVSIDDMHNLLTMALPNSGTSHYWDLPINAQSGQTSDLVYVKGALESGYPVAATVTEVSIFDTELQSNPYFWGPSGTHVLLITGIAPDGNLLVHDEANVTGQLQGTNTPRPQPRIYDASRISLQWASMCRMSWLIPFPANWSAATGAKLNQIVVAPPAPTPTIDYKNRSIVQRWRGLGTDFDRTTVSFASWKSEHEDGRDRGIPLNEEQTKDADGNDLVDETGKKLARQIFTKGTCEVLDGVAHWI